LGLVRLAVGFNFDYITLVHNPIEFFTHLGEYNYWGGEQAAWWGPMAIAVIVGLLFSTLLTLILVPVLYSVIERGKQSLQQLFFARKESKPITE
jgi:Cu/Ag efflux pump CusA